MEGLFRLMSEECGKIIFEFSFKKHLALFEEDGTRGFEILNHPHTRILATIFVTRHTIALLRSLITCPPLSPFQCLLNQTPFDLVNIELGERGSESSKGISSLRYFRKYIESTEICLFLLARTVISYMKEA